LDTVVDGRTGVLFEEQHVECLIEAVRRAEATAWDSDELRAHAQQFDSQSFAIRCASSFGNRSPHTRPAHDSPESRLQGHGHGAGVASVVSRLPFMTQTLYAFDSANYALAVRDFYNVAFHQPIHWLSAVRVFRPRI